MIKVLQRSILFAALFAATQSCHKNDKEDPPSPGQSNRVKLIKNGNSIKSFLYDAQNRLIVVDFGGSFRFTYSPTEITAQAYFGPGNIDPSWKYVFTLTNGRITSGRRYMTNGGIGREYQYTYDNQQRLANIVMSLKNFAGNEDELHHYDFSYDPQNLMQRVNFERKTRMGNNLVNTDSSSSAVTYFMDKSFINWRQMGFDFFGTATVGIEIQGMEVMPFSFTFTERIIASDKAVKQIETKKYRWDQDANAYVFQSTNIEVLPEAELQYPASGLLQKYKTNTIEWQSY